MTQLPWPSCAPKVAQVAPNSHATGPEIGATRQAGAGCIHLFAQSLHTVSPVPTMPGLFWPFRPDLPAGFPDISHASSGFPANSFPSWICRMCCLRQCSFTSVLLDINMSIVLMRCSFTKLCSYAHGCHPVNGTNLSKVLASLCFVIRSATLFFVAIFVMTACFPRTSCRTKF